MDRKPCDYPMNKFHNFEDEVLKGERVSTIKDCEVCENERDLRHCLIQEFDMIGALKNVRGDATEPQTTEPNEIVVIPHVCNNINAFGAGFTHALNKKWEQPEKVYRNFCERNKNVPILGKVCYAKINSQLVIANMIGQNGTVSKDNLIPIKYKALINCMAEVAAYIEIIQCQTSNPVVIHAPKFGSDLAGGDFRFILELIREIWLEEAGIDVLVYEFEPNKDKWGLI